MTEEELAALDRYSRAANYLSVGQIYLMTNPLLTEPLRPQHIKPRRFGATGAQAMQAHAFDARARLLEAYARIEVRGER